MSADPDDVLLAPAAKACIADRLIGQLPAEQQRKVVAALADEGVQSKRIAEYVTRKTGSTLSGDMLSRHRRSSCACTT